MVEEVRSWLKENQALVFFLLAQILALGAAGAGMLAYMVRLETRVHTMETRGAEYTVARMEDMRMRISILEQTQKENGARLERVVDMLTKK